MIESKSSLCEAPRWSDISNKGLKMGPGLIMLCLSAKNASKAFNSFLQIHKIFSE